MYPNQELETLQDIRKIMERSSRFISLSGWSGIAAGICALVGAYFAYQVISQDSGDTSAGWVIVGGKEITLLQFMGSRLFIIALFTFLAACISAFLFTWMRSRKHGVPIWSSSTKRLVINLVVPLVAGGFFLFRMIQLGYFGLIAPGCLIFYGLSLVNASKYTLGEIRYLGYAELLLGILNCWYMGHGLYFWAMGFGVLHIVYGVLMWARYERTVVEEEVTKLDA